MIEHIACPFVPKLMTVSAPTGFGKTIFLTRLYREWTARSRLCIWVSLDRCDSDAARLLTLLERAVEIPAAPEGLDPDGRLEIVVKTLVSRGNPILFLDNLHFCTDPALARLIDTMVFATGAQLRLVLASGIEIPFDKGRARLELNAIDLGVRDLSFDSDAIMNLLTEAGIAVPNQETIDLILEKTEGWPAAVRLIQAVMA